MIELVNLCNFFSVKKEIKLLIDSCFITDIRNINKVLRSYFSQSDIIDSISCVKIGDDVIRVKATFGSIVQVFMIELIKGG